MLEFCWINIPSISNLLSYFSRKPRESLPVAIENVQRESGSGTSDPFRFVVRNLIASLLGDALDAGSSCSFGFASTRLFGWGLFACRKSLCSNLLFYFVVPSTLLRHCSVPWVTPLLTHRFPAASPLILDLLGLYACYSSPWSPRFPSAWTGHVSVNIVYLKASIPYCWTCSLWPKIFPSPMSASDTQLVEPLSLVKAPSSPLYDLSKASSIWMLVYPRI